jgi:hypothetical protein
MSLLEGSIHFQVDEMDLALMVVAMEAGREKSIPRMLFSGRVKFRLEDLESDVSLAAAKLLGFNT